MKKINILPLFLALALILSGCSAKLGEHISLSDAVTGFENNIENNEYTEIADNENLKLLFNKDTTAFKVVDKSNGFEWLSTGSEAQSNSELYAPFKLSYVNESGLIEEKDAMTASIALGQYKYERIDDGVRVVYSIGEYETETYVPLALKEDRLKQIADNIEDEFVRIQFENMYQLTNVDNLDEHNKKEFLNKYPKLSEGPLYILRERISGSSDKCKELSKLLMQNGYTSEMYEEDKKYFSSGDDKEEKASPRFRICIEYKLEKDSLRVKVPYNEIQMSNDFPIVGLELLKYFGSPGENDGGYFLLPDGSGSIMNFYNGRSELQPYSTDIYGTDYAAAEDENIYSSAQAYLPLFGIKNGSNAMLAVIENGDALSTVFAYPGSEQLRAYAFASFKLRTYYKSYMGSGNTTSNYFVSIQNQRYKGDISVSYTFLNGEKADIGGMAEKYRELLFINDQGETDLKAQPLIEFVGQIDKTVKTFGFDVNKKIPLTTFNEAREISGELLKEGIDAFSVKLSGWFAGAYRNSYAGKLNINKQLGNKSDLNKLSDFLNENNIAFYPDADFQYTYKTALLDGFSPRKDTATLVSKSKGYRIEYNPATFMRDPDFKAPAYINSPAAITRAVNSFFKEYSKLNVKSVSLRNMGKNLDGDYSDSSGTDRQTAAESIIASLKKIHKDYGIMTNGANAYTLNYADYCCDIPLKSNGKDITDESVPFLQMVLSGNVSYSGPAINLSGNAEGVILDMALTAANPYYIITAESSDETRDSDYSGLYCSNYGYLKENLVNTVKKYTEDMRSVSGRRITDYKKLADNVYRTVFEGGAYVTVNYGNDDVSENGTVYKARSYTVATGEAE